jgi:hypothetical protein
MEFLLKFYEILFLLENFLIFGLEKPQTYHLATQNFAKVCKKFHEINRKFSENKMFCKNSKFCEIKNW